MIKTAIKLAIIIFLLTAINSCYYEREADQLKVCFIRYNNLWTMNIDGSEQKQIIFDGNNNAPSRSPDGKNILFHSDRDGNNEIYVINADGSGLKQLTHTSLPDTNTIPTWSSDGEEIFFAGKRNVDGFIFIANNDGTILKSFSTGSTSVTALSISPDGEYMYYQLSSVIYKMPIKTGIPTSLLLIPNELSVSPDGNSIVHANAGSITIYNMVTKSDTTISATGKNPCWAPDGETIVFSSTVSNDIYKTNIEVINPKKITTGGGCSAPCVQGKPR